ncbi:MAG TPA: hypothetical protein VGP07_17225 [Polyangia bacterium]
MTWLSGAATTAPSGVGHTLENGLQAGKEKTGRGLDATQAMMWKYVAACALRPDQSLSDPKATEPLRFSGFLGLAPEWLEGTCDDACKQKVSACLLALTNRTGKHVQLSLLSAAARMSPALRPGESDRAFPHQEGVFFGDVFAQKGYVCHGSDERKGPQVKRFCAAEPASCNGLFSFTDAGKCEDVCTMSCTRLGDGTKRCAAVHCRDPSGKQWDFPLTTYLRTVIEAGNADRLQGASSDETQALVARQAGNAAFYHAVDFGPTPTAHRTFVATYAAKQPGAHLEISLPQGRSLGTLTLPATTAAKQSSTTLSADDLAGPQDLFLHFTGPTRSFPLTVFTIEVR